MECKPPEARTRRWKRLSLFFGVLGGFTTGLRACRPGRRGRGGEASLDPARSELGQASTAPAAATFLRSGSSSAHWASSSASSSSSGCATCRSTGRCGRSPS